jgi:rhamnosyltransferase
VNIAIVIPVFRPDGRLKMCIERLLRQSVMPDRILLNILYENPVDREISEIYIDERIEIRYAPREEYDRAGSRDTILRELDSDVVIFMVQTAIPQNRYLVEKLTEPFKEERTAVVYGRHMTDDECSPIECCVRQFNYPPKGMIKSLEDAGKLGIRTFFNSNVCAAYRRRAYLETEGFGKRMIAGEDMLAARRLLEKGWQAVYAPEAEVIYYRNDDLHGLWKRNFDIGVAHAEHPEMIENTKPGKEGVRLVRVTSALLRQNHMEEYLGEVLTRSIVRYLAYQLGRNYERLPEGVVRKCSANKEYWEKK